ncbi:MAG: D-alanyl-D-alanine carboxypeptidase [Actinobacteria bacterium]|nr:D-alanyl-D-alanine carboxypeptidase [Actinomycetota bacterium]
MRLLAPILLAALALAASASAGRPRVDARAFLVQNGANGEIVYEHDARERLPIASITKLMTALVVVERAPLDARVVVSASAVGVPGSTIGLRAGERLTVRELLEASLIQSANDAANALAAHVGRGSIPRFVELMNRRARLLGLADTHFTRPDGLDDAGHLSSARDVTKLARVAMQRPAIRTIVAKRRETIAGGRSLHTWNDLLGTFPGVVGVKTGHTSAAGWSEVAAARGAGFTIYATLLGGSTRNGRNDDLRELLRYGLSRYRPFAVISAGRIYGRVSTEFGRKPIEAVATRALVRVVRVDRPLVERVVVRTVVTLPIRRGAALGEVRIYDRGALIGRRRLVAARAVGRPGLSGRTAWYAGRALSQIRGWL